MKRLAAVVVVLGVIAAIVGCARWVSLPSGSRGLAARVEAMIVATPTNGTFAASAMTDEPWEQLFVFGAYQSEDSVRAALGFDWSDANRVVVGLPEGAAALVFTSGNRVVTYTRFPRAVADFAALERSGGYSYDSIFRKGPGAEGERFPQITVA